MRNKAAVAWLELMCIELSAGTAENHEKREVVYCRVRIRICDLLIWKQPPNSGFFFVFLYVLNNGKVFGEALREVFAPFTRNVRILTDDSALGHVVVLEASHFILINLSNA